MQVDIIGLLPVEIGYRIFEYLPIKQLGRCFKVSKKWYEVANFNGLWKKYCVRYDLAEEETDGRGSSGPLVYCDSASRFLSYVNSPAYNWFHNKYHEIKEDNKIHSNVIFAAHGNYFAAYSYYDCYLRICKVVKDGNRSKIVDLNYFKLKVLINNKVKICMTDNHVVAATNNMALIFSKLNNSFLLSKAVRFNITLDFAVHNIHNFVQNCFDPTVESYMYGLMEKYFWISIPELGKICSINIISNEVHEIPMLCKSNECEIVGNYFISQNATKTERKVYNKSGTLVINIQVGCVNEVQLNDTVVAILLEQRFIKVFDRATKKLLLSEKSYCYTHMKLHLEKEIIYVLNAVLDSYDCTIYSSNVRTGEKLWIYHCYTFYLYPTGFKWNLFEVCGKYLITWPSCSWNGFVCLDSKTGKLMYASTNDLFELAACAISDNVWIKARGGQFSDLTVRSYM